MEGFFTSKKCPDLFDYLEHVSGEVYRPKPGKLRAVLDILKRDGSTTAFDIQKETNTTDARKCISRLKERGFIGEVTKEPNEKGPGFHARYHYSGKLTK